MTQRIKGFDGLRGLAVLFVIISHSILWPHLGIENPKIKILMNGHTGVSIFFVLSGFLITLLLIKEKEATGSIDLVSFIKRRALRIFPLYYLALFLLMYMDYTGNSRINNCAYPYVFAYLANFIPRSCDHQTISHFWSLSVEEHFYLIWPLIFMLGKRYATIIAIVAAIACLKVGTSLYSGISGWYLDRWTFPAALPIIIGCIAALVHKADIIESFFKSTKTSGLILFSILAGLVSPAFMKSQVVWLIAMASLMLYIYYQQDSALVKILEFKPLAMIGIVSYGLYVWQGVFTGNGPYRTYDPFPPEIYTGLWLTFIAAPLSYMLYERPIMSLKKRFSWRADEPAKVS